MLQKKSTTLADARDMQDETVVRYPELGPKLSSTAKIIHSVMFETAVYRVQCGDDSSMTECERACVRSLLIENPPSSPTPTSVSDSIVESSKKRRLVGERKPTSRYIDTRFIQPTLNLCERFFSHAGRSASDVRGRLSAENLEAQLFLHFNQDFWGVSDVQRAM